jgi:hypothetical protein
MKKNIIITIGAVVLALAIIIGNHYKGFKSPGNDRGNSFALSQSNLHKKAFQKTGNQVHDVVYPSTLEFLSKCARCGIVGLGDTNLAESGIQNAVEKEIPGGKETEFSIGNHKFKHLFTTNYLYKCKTGDIQILDCDRIIYCGLKGEEWPWRAITAEDPKGLADIAERYAEHGSFEDAQKIILNLASEFNQPKNDLFDPQFVKQDILGYDLGIVTGVYNSRNDLFSGFLGNRHTYEVVPWKNGTAVLVQMSELKAQFEDKPPTPWKPANTVEGLKTVLAK